jgi:hypothetical protein
MSAEMINSNVSQVSASDFDFGLSGKKERNMKRFAQLYFHFFVVSSEHKHIRHNK